VERHEYTFNNPEVIPSLITYNPAPVIIVEGVFVFYYPEIKRLFDLTLFIEAKEAVKLLRRIKRDYAERGYDLEDVMYRYEHHISPTYEKYIKPWRDEVDFIVPNNDGFDHALEAIASFLQGKLQLAAANV
jgi:uridine kinase